ncbi:MAG: Sulfate-transporting ATPase, partial [Firmicutes bacterium]|nr:Sulfate-transporting ATPase [Bacillota bacterium]
VAGLIFGEGKISAYGKAITAQAMRDKEFAAAYRRKIGFVFQNSDVQLFCVNVLDEVMFGPLAMGMPYAEALQRAQELLAFVGISALAERMPQHLSGGEKKKVAIAAVLAVNPDVLILDEPTNGLDPKTQRWMITTLNALHESGKTLLVATHNLALVPEIADRVIVLGENHQMIADGAPTDILNDSQLLLEANLIDEYCR